MITTTWRNLIKGIWHLIEWKHYPDICYGSRWSVKIYSVQNASHAYLLPVLNPWSISWQIGRDRIVVSTSRCGRDNPGSNPGHGRGCEVSIMACWSAFFIYIPGIYYALRFSFQSRQITRPRPCKWPCGVMVSTLDSESSDPSSNLGRTYSTFFFFKPPIF